MTKITITVICTDFKNIVCTRSTCNDNQVVLTCAHLHEISVCDPEEIDDKKGK